MLNGAMSTAGHDPVPTTGPPRVVRLELRARVLAAIRGGLSVLGAVAAVLVGGQTDSPLLGWAFGAVMVSIILAGDRRRRWSGDPEPLPSDAGQETWAEIARTDVFPSTIGVPVLTVVALAFNAALAGMLSGILGGMALLTVVAWVQVADTEQRIGGKLYGERRGTRLYISASK